MAIKSWKKSKAEHYKTLHRREKLSLDEIAHIFGITKSTVYDMVHGRGSSSVIVSHCSVCEGRDFPKPRKERYKELYKKG